MTIGPSIENGFYYDFDVETPFSPDQFEAIEAEMQRIIDAAVPFERMDISKADAVKLFNDMGEPYKVELIEGLEDGTITLYRNGDFVDLCRGPHIPNAGFVKAFKLLSVAGAYWRGDEKEPYAFPHLRNGLCRCQGSQGIPETVSKGQAPRPPQARQGTRSVRVP